MRSSNPWSNRLHIDRLPIALATVGLLSLPASSGAQDHENGVWHDTGSVPGSRGNHTATLLPSGKILIAGGRLGSSPLDNAALYDPQRGRFEPTGSLRVPRARHTATLLPDKRVLVVGGGDTLNLGGELYDPSTERWTLSDHPLVKHRIEHTATLLTSGKVLVVGGENGAQSYHNTSEIYDPATGWRLTESELRIPRGWHTATRLQSGQVLVVGGERRNDAGDVVSLTSAEIYDPTTETWTPAGELGQARRGHSATLLPSGHVLVAGGRDQTGRHLASTEIFDPVEARWCSPPDTECAWGGAPPMLGDARSSHTATLLPSGTLLVAGGTTSDSTITDSAEMFDPLQPHDGWQPSGRMGRVRTNHSATLLPSGKVLVALGRSQVLATGAAEASAELFDPQRFHSVSTASEPTPRREQLTATLLPCGAVLTVGGTDGTAVLANVELIEPTTLESLQDPHPCTDGWSAPGPRALFAGRSEHTATLLPSSHVLIVGGQGAEGNGALESIEIFDPDRGVWCSSEHTSCEGDSLGRPPEAMNEPRRRHTATLLPDGKLLVVGGRGATNVSLASVEIFDPESRAWCSSVSCPPDWDGPEPMPLGTARYDHTATLLLSGDVLVAGGLSHDADAGASTTAATIDRVEIYDSATGAWATVSPLQDLRANHSATLMPSGEVLVAGGYRNVRLRTVEIYDPITDSWRFAASFHRAHSAHSATLLTSGTVLVVGGGPSSPIEVYEPATDTWAAFDADARRGHTATLLPSGEVLIVGGDLQVPHPDIRRIGLPPPNDARRPFIDSVSTVSDPLVDSFDHVSGLRLEGRHFGGDSESTDGSQGQSVANLPLIQLRSIEEPRSAWLEPESLFCSDPDPEAPRRFCDDRPGGLTISALPPIFDPGWYLLTVVTAGVPSQSELVHLECALDLSPLRQTSPVDGDGQPIPVEPGQSATFSIETRGGRSFLWQQCTGDIDVCRDGVEHGTGWVDIPGATESSYRTPLAVGPESGSRFRVVVDAGCRSEVSDVLTLHIADSVDPGEGSDPPVAVVSPRGGELWSLSEAAPKPANTEVVSWTMSDNIRICRVDVDLLASNDGGRSYPLPNTLPLAGFGAGGACSAPGEDTTSFLYELPEHPPSGQAGSLYKIRVTVTDHAGNSTVAESARPFYIVEPNNESTRTLILWNSDRMPETGVGDLDAALVNLAAHPKVQGRLVDLSLVDALDNRYAAWDADQIDANTLLFGSGGLRDYIHDEWLATHKAVEHLLVVGDDRVIPFARLADRTAIVSENTYPTAAADLTMGTDVDLTADGTQVGAVLATNRYLSDDPLATRGTIGANRLDDTVFLPDLGIGRLVETPDEIVASIATFISSEGVIDLSAKPSRKVAVSAYDFLVDSGNTIRERWESILDVDLDRTLIGQTWTSEDLQTEMCTDEPYGVLSLNGHATHHEVGHPSAEGPFVIEGTPTTDLEGCDLSGSLVYAVGCHSGLPVPDDSARADKDNTRDLPQAMLRAKAMAYLGNTGYGWGLKHGVGYSERLVQRFTQELTTGEGIEIGEAVRRTKALYYLESPYFDAYDEKVSMQWTLFGFPMARFQTGVPTTSEPRRPFAASPVESSSIPYRQHVGGVTIERRVLKKTVADGIEVVPPAHLSRESRRFDFRGDRVYNVFDALGEAVEPVDSRCRRSAPEPEDGTPKGCYYTLNNQTSGQDLATGATDRPLQPLFVSDVGLSGTRFHGFLWLGGTYVERDDWMPIFAELQSNIEGRFDDHGALPSNSKSNGRGKIRHGGPLGDQCAPNPRDRSSLVLEAGEVLRDATGAFAIQRHFESIDTELFYYNNADEPHLNCDDVGPRMLAEHAVSGSTITWTVRRLPDEVDPIWRVVVLWTDNTVDADGRGRWQPVELEAVDDVFRGSLAVFGASRLTYFVQAVDTRGNVSQVSLPSIGSPDREAESGVTHELPQLAEVEIATGEADLGVAFGPTPESVAGLTALSTTVDVTNFGPQDAGGLLITIDVPANLSQASAHGDGWTCAASGSVLRCSRSLLPVGSSAPIHLTGTAPLEGQIALRATAQATSRDLQPYNDSVTRTVPVEPAQRADLTVTQDASLTGDVLSLSIHVANDGPTSAHQATVSALLPTLLHDVSWRCLADPPSRCKSAGVGPLVDRADVVHDGRVRYVVTAHVPSDVRSVIETTATVTPPAGLHDPAPASNTSTIPIDLASPLFADGFESGELTGWSDAVGEETAGGETAGRRTDVVRPTVTSLTLAS